MGIDLAHVRYVTIHWTLDIGHWTLPKTVEGFYQESGRAGRDGLPSHSILYYAQDDARKFSWLVQQQSKSSKNANSTNLDLVEQKLASLEQMVNGQVLHGTRLSTKFFDSAFWRGSYRIYCKGTCDYCKDPLKVERGMSNVEVLKDVNSRPMHPLQGKPRTNGTFN